VGNNATGYGTKPSYAIASDLSGVVRTDDGFGIFADELAATDRLIDKLEAEIAVRRGYLSVARRRRSALMKKESARG